jgi:curved DNA-binding protein
MPAYKRHVRKYHSDVSKEPDAETHFKEAAEAYEALRNTEKCATYDQLVTNYKAVQEFIRHRTGPRVLNFMVVTTML